MPRAPYLDLRGRAGAAGAEEAVGRGGGSLDGGGGGADGVAAGTVTNLVGAAVPHGARLLPALAGAARSIRQSISEWRERSAVNW